MKPPQAIVCVTNDLTTDQRVDRSCQALVKLGFRVLLVGRKLPHSLPLISRSYTMHRMYLLFHKGPFFYACYNIRLFLFLLFRRSRLIVSNDLDTLPAAYFAFLFKNLRGFPWRRRALVSPKAGSTGLWHDCHEYFRGMPELNGREGTTRIWKWIEDSIFPHLPLVTAVNASVANLYSREYGNSIAVIRNVPTRKQGILPMNWQNLGIQPYQKVILYQGAVNIDRGLEEAIYAMKYLTTDAVLVIVGIGDMTEKIQQLIHDENLDNRVIMVGQIPFQELHAYTLSANIGLSIEKDVSVNYHFCLPNKFLDYIQAHLPVLVSPFPEMQAILDRYPVGVTLKSYNPEQFAKQVDGMFNDPIRMKQYKSTLKIAAEELCWENEEPQLSGLLSQYTGISAPIRVDDPLETIPSREAIIDIVSFDIPYPPDYGGVIDVFYTIKALHEAGIRVRLHCFTYHREPAEILENLCEQVFYYPRQPWWRSQFSLTPYIVKSRRSKTLLQRLTADENPVLFEGLHTCGWLAHPGLKNRLKIYRESNIEHDYYRHLAIASRSPVRKLFYRVESFRLKRFQPILAYADKMLTVSRQDHQYLQEMFPGREVYYLPSFHQSNAVNSLPGKGKYALYQGNLGVEENEKAALFIAGKIWKAGMPKLVIAGKNPSAALRRLCKNHTNITLRANPSAVDMEKLIREAHINLMITFQPTGLKLKLLHALFEGRFCLVNQHMLAGTSLDETCVIAETSSGFRESVKTLFQKSFNEADILLRKTALEEYSNKKSCITLLEIVTLLSTKPF